MKQLIKHTALWMGVLLSGCVNEKEYAPESNEWFIEVEAPHALITRATLSQQKDGLDLLAAWEEGDKIHTFIEQQNKTYDAGEVYLVNIEGTTAKFRLEFPGGVNKEAPFVLHAVYGRDAYYDLENEKAAFGGVPMVSQSMDQMKPALYAQASFQHEKDIQRLRFNHYGVYEVVHINNTSPTDVSFQNVMAEALTNDNNTSGNGAGSRSSGAGDSWGGANFTRQWATPVSKNPLAASWCYYPQTRKIKQGSRVLSSKSSQSLTIPAGASQTFVTWYLPSGEPFPRQGITVRATMTAPESQEVRSAIYTSQALVSKTPTMGHTYHINATWNGRLLYIGELVEELQLSQDRIEMGLQNQRPTTHSLQVLAGKVRAVEVDQPQIATATFNAATQTIHLTLRKPGNARLLVHHARGTTAVPILVKEAELHVPLTFSTTEVAESMDEGEQLTVHIHVLTGTVQSALLSDPNIGAVSIAPGGKLVILTLTAIGTARLQLSDNVGSHQIPITIQRKTPPASSLPPGVVIENGVLVKWPCDAIPRDGRVDIPNSVTSIGEGAFYYCTSLKQVHIPNSVTSIGNKAFRYCSKLTQVHIPSSVTTIGKGAFYYCTSLTQINIPNSVTSIGNDAFRYCSELTQVHIPSSVTSIGDYVFADCASLTQVHIPSSVTSIGGGTFYNCTSLTQIHIPNSVTSIGGDAFMHCSSLTQIHIPSSVTSIGGFAFCNCTSLTQIHIPSSVISIGGGAFEGCTGLTFIRCQAQTPPKLKRVNWTDVLGYNGKLIVPRGSKAAYEQAPGWKDCSPIVEEDM